MRTMIDYDRPKRFSREPGAPAINANRGIASVALLILAWFGVSATACRAGEKRDTNAVINKLFENAGLDGAMIIESLDGSRSTAHNPERARRVYPVASTFKILNTLIALEEDAIRINADRLTWDGAIREFPDWNRDQTLSSAFSSSCVWYYQVLARRVGIDAYRSWLSRIGYGSLREPAIVDRFWLDGALEASVEGQIRFLRGLVRRDYPFKSRHYDALAEIMRVDDRVFPRMWAKTGWAAGARPTPIGWYVGYVEAADGVWLFALNMDIPHPDKLPLRRQIAGEALRATILAP